MSNIVLAGPYTIYFKWVICLPGPRQHAMEKTYILLWKYIDAALDRDVFILIYKFKYK